MKIIGAGMSGLLAANIFRKNNPVIFESQDDLPNNHNALLRFRTDSVSTATGISFKRVLVRKQVNHKGENFSKATIKIANEYSKKVTGSYNDRSIWNLSEGYRYIAPPDFISRLSNGCNIQYSKKISDIQTLLKYKCPIISTIPMFNLMKILEWNCPKTNRIIPDFKSRPIWTITFDIISHHVDLYQTIYYSDAKIPFYRISITGSKVIIEFASKIQETIQNLFQNAKSFLEKDFGVDIQQEDMANLESHHQKHGKLIPIDNGIRKKFISWATNNYNIYSLGRWATHRQLLMDDVVNDIRVINNLISSGNYNR